MSEDKLRKLHYLSFLFRGRALANQQRWDANSRREVYEECAYEIEKLIGPFYREHGREDEH